jgi:hypothetical protein
MCQHRRVKLSFSSAIGVIAGVCAMTLGIAQPASAAPGSEASDAERELVERYAPVMMLQAQTEPCGPGEPFGPIAVEAVLDNPEVALRQVGVDDPVIGWAPTNEAIATAGGGIFIDYPGFALDPDCLYETDGRRFNGDHPATIYGRVRPPAEPGEPLIVQYWFYWYFNQWNNTHESDWEGIQIAFAAATAEEALATGPTELAYAQHEGGETARWGDEKIELDGGRPVVHSSAGSHASYFESAVFFGRGASTGFGCDDTTGPSRRVDPAVVLLPTESADASGPLSWLTFQGHWGERGSGPYDAPLGPAMNERWSDPVGWQASLRDGSLTVPGGEGVVSSLVDAFCATVGWGSTQVIQLQTNPWRILAPLAALAVAALWLVRRTSWAIVAPVPVDRSRRNGEILRASLRIVRRDPLTILPPALVAVPVGGAIGWVVHLLGSLPVVDDVIDLLNPTRAEGVTRVFGSLVTGSLGIVIAFWLMVAVMAHRLDDLEIGVASSLGSYVRRLRTGARPLLVTLVLTVVPIAVVAVIPFGLPVALWLFVRWWLAPAVVVRDGLSGRAALRASARATSGRLIPVAAMALITQALVVVGGLVVGLAVLTTATALPLEVLTLVTIATSALITPVAATAMVLVHGSTRAQAPVPAEAEHQPA